MEGVELSLLSGVQGPGLSIIQKAAQYTGSVDLDLSFLCPHAVGPYSLLFSSVKEQRESYPCTEKHGQHPVHSLRF